MASYADVTARVLRRFGEDADPVLVGTATRKAESQIYRSLRHSRMEHGVTLSTDADGMAEVPSDFEALISMREGDTELAQLAERHIPVGLSAPSFYLFNKEVHTNRGDASLTLQYYRRFPSAVDGDPVLSEIEPEMFEDAILFNALLDSGRSEEAAVVSALVQNAISDVNAHQASSRNTRRRMRWPGGARQ